METTPRKIPVAILVRVSTVKQETARQIWELQSYADSKSYEVVEIWREIASGRAEEDERHGLSHVEELARSGAIKKVLVHEISRLARRNSVAYKFVETLEDHRVSLFWHAQGIETFQAQPGCRHHAGAAGGARWKHSESGSIRVWREAGPAPQARRSTARRSSRKHGDILRQLKAGRSVRHTAKITGKGVSTVQRVKLAFDQSGTRLGDRLDRLSKASGWNPRPLIPQSSDR